MTFDTLSNCENIADGSFAALVRIHNAGRDLAPVISNVNCRLLYITDTRLGTPDTRHLVTAMARRLQEVHLGNVTS